MKKIVQFKKEINFGTNVSEIVSISLDHTLQTEEHLVRGTFVVSGEYKLTDASINKESFNYELPFTVAVDKYILDNAEIDIDDFYYEIVNNNSLVVNIDICIDGLEEIIEEDEERCIEIEEKEQLEEGKNEERIDDDYKSYIVYIVREGDTLEQIIEKYQISKELLLDYNDLNEIKIGDKLIIPC